HCHVPRHHVPATGRSSSNRLKLRRFCGRLRSSEGRPSAMFNLAFPILRRKGTLQEVLTTMSVSDLVPSTPAVRTLIWRDLLGSLRENSPVLLAVALYWGMADGLAAFIGGPHRTLDQAGASYASYVPIIVACLAVAFIIWIVHLSLV